LPALSLKARVAFVKDVPAGTPVGYGGTHVTAKPSTIAVIPIGYADGYSRALSNKADVLIGGRRAPVVGCVCMDQMMADVTGVPAAPGDLATLIGKDGTGEITADELAEKAGMIPYEIVTGLSPRVKRFYDDARP
jgi:alanine racemase